jgi:hypothetical protein
MMLAFVARNSKAAPHFRNALFLHFAAKRCRLIRLSGELDGTILGTLGEKSAPLGAPFHAGLWRVEGWPLKDRLRCHVFS